MFDTPASSLCILCVLCGSWADFFRGGATHRDTEDTEVAQRRESNNTMAILITGGAGYIGSVTTELLRARGERVVVLDNLSRGHRDAVAPEVPFYQGDVGDRELIARVVREHDVHACVHFAAFAYV